MKLDYHLIQVIKAQQWLQHYLMRHRYLYNWHQQDSLIHNDFHMVTVVLVVVLYNYFSGEDAMLLTLVIQRPQNEHYPHFLFDLDNLNRFDDEEDDEDNVVVAVAAVDDENDEDDDANVLVTMMAADDK